MWRERPAPWVGRRLEGWGPRRGSSTSCDKCSRAPRRSPDPQPCTDPCRVWLWRPPARDWLPTTGCRNWPRSCPPSCATDPGTGRSGGGDGCIRRESSGRDRGWGNPGMWWECAGRPTRPRRTGRREKMHKVWSPRSKNWWWSWIRPEDHHTMIHYWPHDDCVTGLPASAWYWNQF